MLYLGTDHRGFALKEKIKQYLKEQGIAFEDLGAHAYDPDDDYPDFAFAVAKKVAEDPKVNRGILLCGSGVGVDVAANKEKGIVSGLFFNAKQAEVATEHDYVNIASLPADYLSEEEVREIVKVFLTTQYSQEERHVRRLRKIFKF